MFTPFREEKPFDDIENISFIGGGDDEDVLAHVARTGNPELVAEFQRKAAQVATGNPFQRTDCDHCEQMGAVGVQIAYLGDTKQGGKAVEYQVLALCAPCTIHMTQHVVDDLRQSRRQFAKGN